MSRRGSKRKPVLQLSNASSTLHRYGYSKEFHSKDKAGKGVALALVGNYSDSDSNEQSDNEDQTADQLEVNDTDMSDNKFESTGDMGGTPSLENAIQPSDMDNKLKNFLSEIEAIPVPSSLVSGPSGVSPAHPTQEPEAVTESTGPPIKKTSTNHYSMFVKGEVEFAQKPQQVPATQMSENNVNTAKRWEDEELPEEPTTNWQLVQDESTQYYYYWNMVTNQVTWEIPSDYTQFLLLHQEYEEKIAKYTPEQLKVLQEKKAKKCVQNSDSKLTEGGVTKRIAHAPPVPALTDSRTNLVTKSSSNHLSPQHPESDSDSKKSKHKKEKKSHHKKKHRDKLHDGMSEENKDLSELDKMKASSLSALAKIVPYLSDQEDEDDEFLSQTETKALTEKPVSEDLTNCTTEVSLTNASSNQHLLDSKLSGSTKGAVSESNLVTSEKSQTKTQEALKNSAEEPEASPLTSSSLAGTTGTILTFSGIDSVDDIINSILQPTMPSSTGKEKSNEENLTPQRLHIDKSDGEIAKKSKLACSDVSDNSVTVKLEASPSLDDVNKKDSLRSEEKILDAIKKESLSEEQTVASLKIAQPVLKDDHSSDKNLKTRPSVDKLAKKDVPPSDKISKTVASADVHKRSTSKREATEIVKVDVVEEGEITEPIKMNSHASDKHEKHNKKSYSSSSSRWKDKYEGSSEKKKVLNIVGYESEEEEEGEVRDKKRREESRNSYKKKKKDKKRESSRRHSKDEKPSYPSLFEGKLDKEIISKVTDTLDQAISDIVSKTVSKTMGQLSIGKEKKAQVPEEDKPKTPEEENEEIDFDDLDDIDRALEVALEKKLEQKKVELSKYEEEEPNKVLETDVVSAMTPEVTSLSPTPIAESVNENVPEPTCTPPEVTANTKIEETTEYETKLREDVKSVAELALNKLQFLDISTENLSRLQILFIELQTRQADWIAGGLSTQYFYEQLKVAEGLLEQYELSAVPEGWACQWDRANNRYYYRNKATNRIQWDYPEAESKDKPEEKAAAASEEGDVICTKVESAVAPEEPRRPRSRRSSRHRKRDEKDRSKYDKRSTSHHYRRKRRRRRDHSSSSEESEIGQQHRRHHKSKKKKRHRSERSPSVKIIENPPTPDTQQAEEVDVTNKEDLTEEKATPPVDTPEPVVTAAPPVIPPPLLAPYIIPPPPPEEPPNEDSNIVQDMEESADESYQEEYTMYPDETVYQMMDPTLSSMGVISKPPHIIVPQQCYPNTMMPDIYATYPPPVIMTAGQPCSYLIQAPVPSTYTVPPVSLEPVPELPKDNAVETSAGDAEKQIKKKKKEKKSLATGSSIMMKKKHMSTMVQKWQKVKKEVEKEDMAKELRQAAIRKKIEELK
ncbi:axoneme-associated protein mst101(2) [Biomphalaria glabrata]|nr:axoneme-associated protein mst101(2) [Biomphalaria glabrata]